MPFKYCACRPPRCPVTVDARRRGLRLLLPSFAADASASDRGPALPRRPPPEAPRDPRASLRPGGGASQAFPRVCGSRLRERRWVAFEDGRRPGTRLTDADREGARASFAPKVLHAPSGAPNALHANHQSACDSRWSGPPSPGGPGLLSGAPSTVTTGKGGGACRARVCTTTASNSSAIWSKSLSKSGWSDAMPQCRNQGCASIPRRPPCARTVTAAGRLCAWSWDSARDGER